MSYHIVSCQYRGGHVAGTVGWPVDCLATGLWVAVVYMWLKIECTNVRYLVDKSNRWSTCACNHCMLPLCAG